ncbi:MAG: hypothetical protein ACO3SO_01090 [Luteolibacter sp.]
MSMRPTLLSLVLTGLAATAAAPAAQRPNIVWIFSDDHTQQAIGPYGQAHPEVGDEFVVALGNIEAARHQHVEHADADE